MASSGESAALQNSRSNRSPHCPDHATFPRRFAERWWKRDGGRCAFMGLHGRCSGRAFLEYHHIVPFGAGGTANVDNIQLRCRAHNAYEAQLSFGCDFVREVAQDANSFRNELAEIPASRCGIQPNAPTLCSAVMRMPRLILLVVACCSAVIGCSRDQNYIPTEVFVPSDAKELKFEAQNAGVVSVAYQVSEPYPAHTTREAVASHLRGKGYAQLDHDALDPGAAKLAMDDEWSRYEDGRTSRRLCVQERVEDWQDTSGKVIRIEFRYEQPAEASRSCVAGDMQSATLNVMAIVIPPETVKRAQETFKRLPK